MKLRNYCRGELIMMVVLILLSSAGIAAAADHFAFKAGTELQVNGTTVTASMTYEEPAYGILVGQYRGERTDKKDPENRFFILVAKTEKAGAAPVEARVFPTLTIKICFKEPGDPPFFLLTTKNKGGMWIDLNKEPAPSGFKMTYTPPSKKTNNEECGLLVVTSWPSGDPCFGF